MLVDGFIRIFNLAGVDVLRLPEFSFRVEALIEIPLVASWVAEGEPEAVRCVLRKEARRHRPDGVWDTACFVEYDHHTVEVVHARVRVGVLLRPQPAFDRPVPRAFLQVSLDDLRQPLGRHHPRRGHLEPMTVEQQ